jgi:CHAD domain-containing protein
MNKFHLSSKTLLQYKDEQLKLFEVLLKKASKHPRTKNIHQIRVTMRRLAVVISSRNLQKLAKVLGNKRDLDVAIENARNYGLRTGKLERAQKKARKKSKRVLKAFNPMLLKRPPNKNILMAYKIMMRKLTEALASLEKMDMDKKQLHLFRITLKQVRYGLEAVGLVQENLQKLQDLLGRIHDLEKLQKLKGKNTRIKKDEDKAIQKVVASYEPVIRAVRKILVRI